MAKEEKNQDKEVVAKIEEIQDTNYRKDYISFVVKPLHIDQANRWARWCDDRGLRKQHHKAFALALDILEGKTQDLINTSKILENMERALDAHDKLLTAIIQKLQDKQSEESEGELDPNAAARENVRIKKERRREAEEKRKAEGKK